MAGCFMPMVMSMVPVVYEVHNSWCGETKQIQQHSTLSEILEHASSDIPPPVVENSYKCVDVLFAEILLLK